MVRSTPPHFNLCTPGQSCQEREKIKDAKELREYQSYSTHGKGKHKKLRSWDN